MPKNSLLYFKSRSINKFKARIKKLFVLSNKGFINEKKKKKFKDNSMIFPKLDQLDFFLKISGLEIK